MTAPALAIKAAGLVTSIGLSAPATCAALRAKVSGSIESAFLDSMAESINVQEVQLPTQWRGRYRLTHMAALAIKECLSEHPRLWQTAIPIVLCVAELDRPGRIDALDMSLLADICAEAGIGYAQQSEIMPLGRVAATHALARCQDLLKSAASPVALIVAVDSLLVEETLEALDRADRIRTSRNSNGFIPGEGAGAVLVGISGATPELRCSGLGFATEAAHIETELPLRGEGLSKAVRTALAQAACGLHDVDYRGADISGEHYYFKESALMFGRLMRSVVPEIDLWLPAECIGETGALAGVVMLIAAETAARKGYAPGPRVLVHMANDQGQRAAAVLDFWSSK